MLAEKFPQWELRTCSRTGTVGRAVVQHSKRARRRRVPPRFEAEEQNLAEMFKVRPAARHFASEIALIC